MQFRFLSELHIQCTMSLCGALFCETNGDYVYSADDIDSCKVT